MKLVDAQPVFREGRRAVWLMEDIPVGVLRSLCYTDIHAAFSSSLTIVQAAHDKTDREGYFAAVAWADLQPIRGRESMPAEKWGTTAPPWGAWMPGTEGGVVDAPTAARIHVPAGLQVRFRRYADNAAIAQDVWRASDGVRIAGCVAVRGLCASAPAASFQQVEFEDCPLQPTVPFKPHPSPKLVERVLVAMGAASGEDANRSKISPENRALWAAALRARVQASAERERNRVVVDREVEDWE